MALFLVIVVVRVLDEVVIIGCLVSMLT